jgi:hypothetical protein
MGDAFDRPPDLVGIHNRRPVLEFQFASSILEARSSPGRGILEGKKNSPRETQGGGRKIPQPFPGLPDQIKRISFKAYYISLSIDARHFSTGRVAYSTYLLNGIYNHI